MKPNVVWAVRLCADPEETDCIEWPLPSCGEDPTACYCVPTGDECGSYPGDQCLGAAGGWDFKWDGQCVRRPADELGCEAQWYWEWNVCSAADRCEDAGAGNVAGQCGGSGGTGSNSSGVIMAGVCNAGGCPEVGCQNGGWYKTCCIVDGDGKLTGERGNCGNGFCPGDNNYCIRDTGCDPTKELDYEYFYCWYTKGAGLTPTPVPTLPPGVTPTPTSPPPGALCILDVVGDTHTAGDIVEVAVYQASHCGNTWDRTLENIYTLTAPPGGPLDQLGPNCEEIGPYGPEAKTGQWLSCYWDTGAFPPGWASPYPLGTYTIELYYPGFACSGGDYRCSDTVTLVESRPPEVISVTANPDPASETDTVVFSAVYKDMEKLGYLRTWLGIQQTPPYGDQEKANCQEFEDSLVNTVGVMYNTWDGAYEVANQSMLECPWSDDRFNSPGTAEVTGISSSMVEHADYYQFNVDYTVEFDNALSPGGWNLYLMARQWLDGVGIGNCPNHPDTPPQCWEIKGSFNVSEAVGSISGQVFDSSQTGTSCLNLTNRPSLEGAIVTADKLGDGELTTSSGSGGSYSFSDLSGTYWLSASKTDYTQDLHCDGTGDPVSLTIPPDCIPECTDINFGLTITRESWFQTGDGDVHAVGNIDSEIPSDCAPDLVCDPNFSIGSAGTWGVVSYDTGTADFGDGYPSNNTADHWLANTSQNPSRTYDYFYQLLGSPTLESPPAGNDVHTGDLPASDGVKAYDGDIKTGGNWNIGTKKLVVLVNGKFLIKNKIRVDSGGSLVVIAKNGIGISKNLVAKGTGGNKVQGIFITDSTFYSSVNEDFGFTPVDSNKELVIDGGVIAGSFNLRRDLGDDNSTTPAEKFRFDPGLVINSYPDLWKSRFTWQELAP